MEAQKHVDPVDPDPDSDLDPQHCSKESIPPVYVAWQAGTITPIPTRFLAPIDCLKIPALVYCVQAHDNYEFGFLTGESRSSFIRLTVQVLSAFPLFFPPFHCTFLLSVVLLSFPLQHMEYKK